MQPTSKQPPSKPSEQVPLEDCLRILLRGIQNHPVVAEGTDGQEFRAQLAALEGQLQGNASARHVVDSAVEVLSKYEAQANEVIARQKSGLTVAVERWNTVEEQIKAISSQEDLEAAKARLLEQITSARAEVLEAVGNPDSHASGRAIEPSRTSAGVHVVDALTGWASRAYAELELARALGQPDDCFLALFIVKRLALINAKFGYSRGDQVLLKVVVHLGQSLPGFDKLFRWSPCAFLAVAPPETSYKDLRARVQVIELTRLTPTLEWEGRSAMVPVVIDCRIVSVKDFGTASDLFLRLDTLAADA
jgi:GGDEF domain-containing protein